MYIDDNPIRHVINEVTRFQAAIWLRDQTHIGNVMVLLDGYIPWVP
jgi:hypothetical protein